MSNAIENMTSRQRTGRIGEEAVALRYAEMGFSLVDRNVHVSRNEIDLILKNKTYLVFVEVKTRHATPGEASRYGRPAAAIDKSKRARMRRAAVDYLRAHPTSLQPRIDVAEVYMKKGADGTDDIQEIKIFPAAYAGR